MDLLFAAGVFSVIVVIAASVALVVLVGAKREFARKQSDEFLRAGGGTDGDPNDAERRATGGAAWMQPGGGAI